MGARAGGSREPRLPCRPIVARRPIILRGPHGAGHLGIGFRSPTVFTLDSFVHFLAVYRYRLGGFDAKPDLVPSDVDDRNDHVVADHDAFVSVPRKDQHGVLVQLLVAIGWGGFI
jgi:hypothetical protein